MLPSTIANSEAVPAWRALPDRVAQISRASAVALVGLQASVRNDARKTFVVTVLIAMASAWCGRTLLGKKTAPAASQAAIVSSQSDQIHTRSAEANSAFNRWAQQATSAPSRNLFRLAGTENAGVYGPLRFWEAVAKSVGESADQLKERKRRLDQITEEANQLRVQLTVMGSQPRAVINGRSVGEGEIVASFRIVRIEARRVIVEREGIKLEIGMR